MLKGITDKPAIKPVKTMPKKYLSDVLKLRVKNFSFNDRIKKGILLKSNQPFSQAPIKDIAAMKDIPKLTEITLSGLINKMKKAINIITLNDNALRARIKANIAKNAIKKARLAGISPPEMNK